jgi:hypothetical protein
MRTFHTMRAESPNGGYVGKSEWLGAADRRLLNDKETNQTGGEGVR